MPGIAMSSWNPWGAPSGKGGSTGAAVVAAIAAIASVITLAAALTGCSVAPRPFPLREPMTRDTDTQPVTVACAPEPSAKDRRACAARRRSTSRRRCGTTSTTRLRADRAALSIEVDRRGGQRDEPGRGRRLGVVRRTGSARSATPADALGACKPEELLPDEVADRAGSSITARTTERARVSRRCPGQGPIHAQGRRRPAARARERGQRDRRGDLPRGSGSTRRCEQVVYVRRAQLDLKPGADSSQQHGHQRTRSTRQRSTAVWRRRRSCAAGRCACRPRSGCPG